MNSRVISGYIFAFLVSTVRISCTMIQFLVCFILALSVDAGTCEGKSNTKGDCVAWANIGHCTGEYAEYMTLNCGLACCQEPAAPPPPPPAPAAPAAVVSGKRCEAKQSNTKPLDVIRINSVKDITYDQCEALCEGNQECAGFVYQKNNRRIECWMYKSTNGVVDVPEKENKSFTSCPVENPCLGRSNIKAPYGPGYKKCGELLTKFAGLFNDKKMLNECNLAVCEKRNHLEFTTTAPTGQTLEMMVGGTCEGKSNTKGDCVAWANIGHCTGEYAEYMILNCGLACCQETAAPPPPPPAPPAPAALVSGKRCEAKQSNTKPLDVIRINSVKDITYDQCEALCEG